MPVWRYSKNPIIPRQPKEHIDRVFNSAVTQYNGSFIGVFRMEGCDGIPQLYLGHSEDAINWSFEDEPISFRTESGEPFSSSYSYDPRIVKIDDEYYIQWCLDCFGPVIGLARTKDFKTFIKMENITLPCNRNGVLFPRRVGGKILLLSRPSDLGHTPFGDIYLSESEDFVYWGRHRHVFGPRKEWWQALKVGAGPQPIETDEGWLMFYHGVHRNCNSYVYSMGAAILDREQPSKVLYRCKNFLLAPQQPYEVSGFVPNVVFPCGILHDDKTGRIALYYGCADTCIGLAFTTVDEILEYIKANNALGEHDNEA